MIVIDKWKRKIRHFYQEYIESLWNFRRKNLEDTIVNRIFILGIPEHNNLGDHAIAYATQLLINTKIPDAFCICILESDFYLSQRWLRKNISTNSTIILLGGGNIGNLYWEQEDIRRLILRKYSHTKTLIFPQTIYFTKDAYGKAEMQNSINIYSKHANLTIVAREKISYEIFRKKFVNNNILLTPDIVMSINKTQKNSSREGALMCIRKDLEGILNLQDIVYIQKLLKKKYKTVKLIDTCIGCSIILDEREELLEEKWQEFRNSELVVTDRLHGVIFAAITSTPCIVIDNYNHKVKGVYQWLKKFEFIKYCKDMKEITSQINCFSEINQLDIIYNEKIFDHYYNKIIKVLKE